MNVMIVGSDPGCDVRVVDDEYVSARHAKVWRDEAGQVWVEDLGATNGTFISKPGNAHRFDKGRVRVPVGGRAPMFPGDTLWLGGRTAIEWEVT